MPPWWRCRSRSAAALLRCPSCPKTSPKPRQNHQPRKILFLQPQGFAGFFQKTFKKGVDIPCRYVLTYNHGRGQHPTDRQRKGVTTTARKTTTSAEVKARWESKAYKKYLVRLRVDDDEDIIAYIENNKESKGTTDLFRAGIEKLMSEES